MSTDQIFSQIINIQKTFPEETTEATVTSALVIGRVFFYTNLTLNMLNCF